MSAYEVDPYGDDWLQTAVVAANVAAPWASRRPDLDDFIPFRGRRQRGPMDPRMIEAAFRLATAGMRKAQSTG